MHKTCCSVTNCLKRIKEYQTQVVMTSDQPNRRPCKGLFQLKETLWPQNYERKLSKNTFLIPENFYEHCWTDPLDIYWLIYDLFIETLSTRVLSLIYELPIIQWRWAKRNGCRKFGELKITQHKHIRNDVGVFFWKRLPRFDLYVPQGKLFFSHSIYQTLQTSRKEVTDDDL